MSSIGDKHMREAFEKWASDDGSWLMAIEKRGGQYILTQTAWAWAAWQAAWLECQIANAKEG